MNAGRIGRRVRVSGRVQGVGFRYATAEKAHMLGLGGYAENLRDGRVEVLACGLGSQVQELIVWLHHGPPAARVTGIEIEDAAGENALKGFEIRS